MNQWLQQSIEYANQRSYLDDLFRVYPTIPDGIMEVDQALWREVEQSFELQDNEALVRAMLKMKLFPIKDSYVAYLKKDPTVIARNPQTINRLAGRMYEMGLNKLFESCSQPKETNRQIGPMFRSWVRSKALGIAPVPLDRFLSSQDNAILDGSDAALKNFAYEHLGYPRSTKGLDFVARFGGRYIIGEAKFITDMGGHQNAQMQDALLTLEAQSQRYITIAILDGVLYIPNKGKLYHSITTTYRDAHIMSALVLRNFLYSL